MGAVYAAYDPELDRKIALKVLHPGARTGSHARERLLREAQALARLSHPNVVAVHDVGVHDEQVFVAMEFIAGATLSATIEGRKPDNAEILRLYRAAGDGLAAAHRAGLVHRDFKPDNVMVGQDGRVRVVDFGLAQAAAESRTVPPGSAPDLAAVARTGLTATGALMGTPAYMAPEQYLGQPTDARTDVVAFCVALYEHLHGRRPFQGDTLAELAESIVSGDLPDSPPGARVPGRLRRILLRGLAPDPAHRYPSMEALLADLDRELARPRRRRAWLLGGALGLTAALAGGLALWGPDRAAARCARTADEFAEVWSSDARDAGARAFAATGQPYAADAWTRTAARIDAWTAEWTEARRDACLEAARRAVSPALVDRRAGCFDRQRARLGALLDVFAAADPKIVERAGEVVAGLPDSGECSTAALSVDGPPPPSPERAPAVDDLRRRLAAADTRFRATYAEAALAAVDELLEEARALGDKPVVAEAAAVAAEAYALLVRGDPAEERFLEAMTVAEAVGDTRRLATILPRWVRFLVRVRSAFTEARHADRRADALLERLGGDEALLFSALESRASLTHSVGDDIHAREHFEAAIALGERLYGPDSLRLADLHNNFGGMLANSDVAAARKELARAFEIWERTLGPDHPKIAYATSNLGRTASERQDMHEAERLYRDVYERFRRLDPAHPHLGPTLSNIASAVEYIEGPERSLDLRRQALEHIRRNFGEEHTFTAQALLYLGTAEANAGHFDDARAHLEAGLVIQRRLAGDGTRDVWFSEARLLDLDLAVDDLPAARARADALLSWFETWAEGNAERGRSGTTLLALIAEARRREGRLDEATELAERVIRLEPGKAIAAPLVLARIRLARGDVPRALELARGSLALLEVWPNHDPRGLREARELIAELERRAPRK